MAKREFITIEEALSHPFANGKYDHEHANMDFILGHESYKEWLETLPVFTEQDIVKPYLEKIKKLLKETYLEVSNIDLDTKTIGDTQSLPCSKFRNSMISKIDNLLIK